MKMFLSVVSLEDERKIHNLVMSILEVIEPLLPAPKDVPWELWIRRDAFRDNRLAFSVRAGAGAPSNVLGDVFWEEIEGGKHFNFLHFLGGRLEELLFVRTHGSLRLKTDFDSIVFWNEASRAKYAEHLKRLEEERRQNSD